MRSVGWIERPAKESDAHAAAIRRQRGETSGSRTRGRKVRTHTRQKGPLPTRRLPICARAPLRANRLNESRPRLAAAADAVLESRELLDADWPARMQTASGDTDLGAKAELAAIGKLGRRVVQDDC